jgi:hypothetical protein
MNSRLPRAGQGRLGVCAALCFTGVVACGAHEGSAEPQGAARPESSRADDASGANKNMPGSDAETETATGQAPGHAQQSESEEPQTSEAAQDEGSTAEKEPTATEPAKSEPAAAEVPDQKPTAASEAAEPTPSVEPAPSEVPQQTEEPQPEEMPANSVPAASSEPAETSLPLGLTPLEAHPEIVVGSAHDYIQGGSRLQPAQEYTTFHDTELDFDCTFALASDHETYRCVPNMIAPLVYLDEDCSEPATWLEQEPSEERVWVSAVDGGRAIAFAGTFEVPEPERGTFEVGEEVYAAAVRGSFDWVAYAWNGEACVETETGYPKSTPAVYRLIPHEETELVLAARIEIRAQPDLWLHRFVAEDGAAKTIGTFTSERRACEFQRDGECVPLPFPSLNSGIYLDSDCTNIAYYLVGADPTPGWPYYFVDISSEVLGIYSLSTPQDAFAVRLDNPPVLIPGQSYATSCQLQSDEWTLSRSFAVQANVTGTFPTAQRVTETRDGQEIAWHAILDQETGETLLAGRAYY